MMRILLALYLAMMIFSTAAAQTIVRHERTAHTGHSPTAERAEDGWEEVTSSVAEESSTEAEVITVYGPYRDSGRSAAASKDGRETEKQQAEQETTRNSDEAAARARLEKFIGQEPQDRIFWRKEGVEESLPYSDCIYMLGGTKGQEDYVIAMRRQGNPEPLAPDLYSLLVLVGRGQLGRAILDTEKLPSIELEQGGLSKEITFIESRVRLPEAFMLRIDNAQVKEIAIADSCRLIFCTDTGNKIVVLPREVRKEWLKLQE